MKFRLGNKQVYRSKTIPKTLNPVWNEQFTAVIDDVTQPLVLRVFDSDFAFQDDYLGTSSIDLLQLRVNRLVIYLIDIIRWLTALFKSCSSNDMRLELTNTGKEGEEVWGTISLSVSIIPKTYEDREVSLNNRIFFLLAMFTNTTILTLFQS